MPGILRLVWKPGGGCDYAQVHSIRADSSY